MYAWKYTTNKCGFTTHDNVAPSAKRVSLTMTIMVTTRTADDNDDNDEEMVTSALADKI